MKDHRPYQEVKNKDCFVRQFSQDLSSFELVWHRDKEDRYVEATHDTDWKFQFDNDLPVDLSNKKLFIPKETYHRLIKGTGDLTLKIYKLWIVIVKSVSAVLPASVTVVIVNYETN